MSEAFGRVSVERVRLDYIHVYVESKRQDFINIQQVMFSHFEGCTWLMSGGEKTGKLTYFLSRVRQED